MYCICCNNWGFFSLSKTIRHWNWKVSIRLSSLCIPCCAMSCLVLLQMSWNVVLCEMHWKVFAQTEIQVILTMEIFFPLVSWGPGLLPSHFCWLLLFLCFSAFKIVLLTHSSSSHSFSRLKHILRGVSFLTTHVVASLILRKIGECAFFHWICRTPARILVKKGKK